MTKANPFFELLRTPLRNRTAEGLLRKFTEGRDLRDLICRIAPNSHQYSRPTWRKSTRNGLNLDIDISDYIGWHYYFGFKETEHEQLYSQIDKDSVIMDIGANIGLVSLQMAQLAPQGELFSFEPFPETFSQLKRNIQAQELSCSIESFNIGLSDSSGMKGMTSPIASNQGMNKISEEADISSSFMTMDEFVEREGISKIDLIKIDVEGHELRVLTGGAKTLSKFHPKLFIELDDLNLSAYGDSASALVHFLSELGYTISSCTDGAPIHPSDSFSGKHMDIFAHYGS